MGIRRHPLDLPDELQWSPAERIVFALGAWVLLFCPAIFIIIVLTIMAGLAR